MAKGHSSHQSKGAQKYINPITVPAKNKIQINADDPRNNESTFEDTFVVYEVAEEFVDLEYLEEEDLYEEYFDEGTDPDVIMDENPYEEVPLQEDVMVSSGFTVLEVPQNLYIDPLSYQLEDSTSSSDGAVRWVASLVFDDVDGASDYDYVINASE
jgi:hypothetical protein